jgi:hypothetical protein
VRTGGYGVVYCLKTFVASAVRTVALTGVEMSFVQPIASTVPVRRGGLL